MFNVYAASRCTVFTVPCWNVMLTALSLIGILMGVAQTKVEPQRTVCQQCNCSLWAPWSGNFAEPFTKHLLEYTLGASRPDFPPLQSHQLQRVNNTRLPCSKGYSQRLMDLAVGTSYHLTLRCWVVIVFIYFSIFFDHWDTTLGLAPRFTQPYLLQGRETIQCMQYNYLGQTRSQLRLSFHNTPAFGFSFNLYFVQVQHVLESQFYIM